MKPAAPLQAARTRVTGWGVPAHGCLGLPALLPQLQSKYETPVQTQPAPQPGLPLHPLWEAFQILASGT